ncbi:hypothetical protein CROQUDRAFT_100483 [Cronartium quercuum f. sp. fusiforme G11]|uniref:Uncharacterized protein n=1 Tax=Cronartium quercuum f. sp. fusiforme G11 TaxID=708437 RepID=A0A9P6NA18_9BASI|nr:hypothetical protein CROQUDRAFT_100483 [Cronartium quercuum f. sp. fusiforme G11]
MDRPTDFEAILKQMFKAQQKQLASQNRLIEQMEERATTWDLSAVPKPPIPALVAEFNARFSDVSDINGVLDSLTAQDLVDRNQVVTFSEARAGRMKIGHGIVNIKEFFVMYAQAMFAKLGIWVWAPDLDAADDSLWNEACQISAIRIFRQWVAADAFVYMNINKKFTNDILLLERTYNHYVHYWIAQKYKQESKEEGANQAADDRKNVQTN